MKGIFDDEVDCKRILREISILKSLKSNFVVGLFDLIEPASPETFDQLKEGKVDTPISLLKGAIRLEGVPGSELITNESMVVLVMLPATPVTEIL